MENTAEDLKQEGSVDDRRDQRVTLGTHEMPRAVRFYRALGFEVLHGGEQSSFTSFRAGTSYLNPIAQPAERRWSWWGRVSFTLPMLTHFTTVRFAAGYQPATAPRDAEWATASST